VNRVLVEAHVQRRAWLEMLPQVLSVPGIDALDAHEGLRFHSGLDDIRTAILGILVRPERLQRVNIWAAGVPPWKQLWYHDAVFVSSCGFIYSPVSDATLLLSTISIGITFTETVTA